MIVFRRDEVIVLGAFILLIVIVIAIVAVIVLAVMSVKRKSLDSHGIPGVPTGPPPGWYPDPNDPNYVRYFDGQAWTESTQPWG